MSGNAQCYVCNLNPDAEFFLTDRHVYPDVDILPQPVIAICMDCLINMGREFEKARLAAIASAPDSVGTDSTERAGAGDDGAPTPSSPAPPKRGRKAQAQESDETVPQEAEASDVDR